MFLLYIHILFTFNTISEMPVKKTWTASTIAWKVTFAHTFVHEAADEKKPEFRLKPEAWHLWIYSSVITRYCSTWWCLEARANDTFPWNCQTVVLVYKSVINHSTPLPSQGHSRALNSRMGKVLEPFLILSSFSFILPTFCSICLHFFLILDLWVGIRGDPGYTPLSPPLPQVAP